MKLSNLLWAAVLILCTQIACTSDNKTNEADIVGQWNIAEATRNGKPTESLAKLFFEFQPDGKMRTNILGAATDASYKLSNNQVMQRESDMDIDYEVEQLTDSVLIMSTELRGYAFRFILNRVVAEE